MLGLLEVSVLVHEDEGLGLIKRGIAKAKGLHSVNRTSTHQQLSWYPS